MGFKKCGEGQDFVYLAHAAAASDFSALEGGSLKPDYFSSDGKVIAEWVLSRKEGTEIYPPTFSTLVVMFPEIGWPTGLDKTVDPSVAAEEVLFSYQSHLGIQLIGLISSAMKDSVDKEGRSEVMDKVISGVKELETLGETTSYSRGIGDDTSELIECFIGKQSGARFSELTMPWKWLSDAMEPIDEGIYTFFARPKAGKSWVTQLIALHWAMVHNQKVLLVDPENSRTELIQRLTAFVFKLFFQNVVKLKMSLSRDIKMTKGQEEFMNLLDKVVKFWGENRNIEVLGKEAIDPKFGGFTITQILKAAKKHGASIIAAEQIHKYVDERASRSSSDVGRLHKAVVRMANEPGIVWLATTQENRQRTKARKGEFPDPSDDSVFGSDAASQNSTFLAHIEKVDLGPNDEDPFLWMFTPLKSRRTSVSGHYFVKFRPCDLMEEMDPRAGAVLFMEKRLEIEDWKDSVIAEVNSRRESKTPDVKVQVRSYSSRPVTHASRLREASKKARGDA